MDINNQQSSSLSSNLPSQQAVLVPTFIQPQPQPQPQPQQQQQSLNVATHNAAGIPFCDSKYYQAKKHKCAYCDYRSVYPHSVRRHEQRKHGAASTIPLKHTRKRRGDVIGADEPMILNSDDDDDDTVDVDNDDDKDDDDETMRQVEGDLTEDGGQRDKNQQSRGDLTIGIRNKTYFNIQLEPHFKIFISGPSRSGKSFFIGQLLSNLENISSKPPQVIIYVFKHWQEKLKELKTQNLVDLFLQGGNSDLESKINDYRQQKGNNKDVLIIFDDQLYEAESLKYAAQLYSIEGRHTGMSLCFISQKIFWKSEYLMAIRDSSDYFVFFKNPKDVNAINLISTRMTKNSTLTSIYASATEAPFSYLFIDTRQQSNKYTRFLSNLFDRDHVVTAYILNMAENFGGKKRTTFNKMFLVSGDKLNEELSKIKDIENKIMQEKEQQSIMEPVVQNSTAERIQLGKRRKEEDEDYEDGPSSTKKTKISTVVSTDDNSNQNGLGLGAQETVVGGKRDLGIGRDDDYNKAAEAKRRRELDLPSDPSLMSATPAPAPAPPTPPTPPAPPAPPTTTSTPAVETTGAATAEIGQSEQEVGSDPFKDLTCQRCGFQAKNPRGLKTHITRKHSMELQSEMEGRVKTGVKRTSSVLNDDDLNGLKMKKARVSQEGHCVCKICNKHFYSARQWDQHVRQVHVDVEPSLLCNPLDKDKNLQDRKKSNRAKALKNKRALEKEEDEEEEDEEGEEEDEEDGEDNFSSRSSSTEDNSRKQKRNSFSTNRGNKIKALKEEGHVTCQLCNAVFSSEKQLREHHIKQHQSIV